MESDPHPAHTDCPSIANVGLLQPGQSKTTFGFANDRDAAAFTITTTPRAAGLQGRIVIQ